MLFPKALKEKQAPPDPIQNKSDEPNNPGKVLKDFAEATTCHGVGRVTGSKSPWLKGVWALFSLAAFGVFCSQLYLLLDKYYSYPVTIDIQYNTEELVFPVVTFCNQNRFRKSQQSLGGEEFTSTIDYFAVKMDEQITGKANVRKKRGIQKETSEILNRVKRATECTFYNLTDGVNEISDGPYHVANVAMFNCTENYVHDKGDLELECLTNFIFNGTLPTCLAFCPLPPVPPHAIQLSNLNIYYEGHSITYNCTNSTSLNFGNLTRRCNGPDDWGGDIPECRGPDCNEPALGNNSHTLQNGPYHTDILFETRCNDGYVTLSGSEERVCLPNGSFDGQQLQCQLGVECQYIPVINATNITSGPYHPGMFVRYDCLQGFTIVTGAVKRYCQTDGSWNKTQIQCTEMNECASGPCQNGGTCHDGINHFTCTCNTGYGGVFCHIVLTECIYIPLANGTNMTTGPYYADMGHYVEYICLPGFVNISGNMKRWCTIAAGWNGTAPICMEVDQCSSLPCQNDGTCEDEMDGYQCLCSPGYTGTHCETDGCSSNACLNQGTCLPIPLGLFSCSCLAGYSGNNCQTDIDECASSPCHNGGTCVDDVNSYICVCKPGYTAEQCQTEISTTPVETSSYITSQDRWQPTVPVMSTEFVLVPNTDTILIEHDVSTDYFEPEVDMSDKPWFHIADTPDVSTELAQNLTSVLQVVPITIQREMGHRIDEMLQECTWNGKQCSPLNFSGISNPTYGNCYSFNEGFNSEVRKVSKEGPLFGLTMVLYIQQNDYIKTLSTSAGVRMLIHTQGVQPFPEEEGFDIQPGQKLSVKLNERRIERLGEPYTPCRNDTTSSEEILYSKNYSIKACLNSCVQNHTISSCKCGNPNLPLVPVDTVPCATCEEKRCMTDVRRQIINKTKTDFSCDCPVLCRDLIYGHGMSVAAWPGDAYMSTMRDMYSERGESVSDAVSDDDKTRQNFLKVEIYFEQLRVITEIEQPAYGIVNLLADIGGQLGLWIGISILTLAEFVQLAVELVIVIVGIKRKRSVISTTKSNLETTEFDKEKACLPNPGEENKIMLTPVGV